MFHASILNQTVDSWSSRDAPGDLQHLKGEALCGRKVPSHTLGGFFPESKIDTSPLGRFNAQSCLRVTSRGTSLRAGFTSW